MSKKLAAKAGLIQALNLPPVGSARQEPMDVQRPKTAPGSMLQFMSGQSAAIKEADDLRDRLKEFEGASPVRLLDPETVHPSRWANRHEASFQGADFVELKAEIGSAGGNVQPIRVRPMRPALNRSTPVDGQYELVYGHRRHRACLELGLQVAALVEDATDQELFEAMERENRGRKNLSAWEQGCMYRRALDEGLYPSLRKLSEALGVDVSLVSKSVALSRLPDAVVETFPSPIDIQFRWAQPLSEALQKDPEGLMERAKVLRQQGAVLTAVQVFERLTQPQTDGLADRRSVEKSARKIGRTGQGRAVMSTDAQGRVLIKFEAGALSSAQQDELAKLIETFLGAS